MKNCVMGIDLGTSSVKAILVSGKGEVISVADSAYPLSTPRPGWAEQDPELWWQGTVEAVQNCLQKAQTQVQAEPKEGRGGPPFEVEAIGLSGQMHGSVFLNKEGQVLRPALLWCDQRTESQCREIIEVAGGEKLIEHTRNPALTGFTAPKILWLRKEEPEIYSQVHKILLPKDYIRYRLTGQLATEVTDASGTLLFDVARRQWSDYMLESLRIPREWMPECTESPDISGYISKEAAGLLGLRGGIPVVGGGGDQAAGAVGNGIVNKGLSSCVLGTSGVLFWPTEKPVLDPQGRLHCFCHAVPGQWHLMGVTLSAGGSLQWFRDNLCHEEVQEAREEGTSVYKLIDRQAESIVAGAEGLIFLPYLAGERTPYPDPTARGAFIGLSLRHGKAHMARALMEGVSMSLRDCLELGRQLGLQTTKVCLSGGGARSRLWQQITADVFNLEIFKTKVDEGPAYGAAVIASVGAGFHNTVEEAANTFTGFQEPTRPDSPRADFYQRLYEIYVTLYPALKNFYTQSQALLEESQD